MARPRTASLRVQHQRSCANYPQSALASASARSGCNCSPTYYTFHRVRQGGKLVAKRGDTISNRKIAERALLRLRAQIDEGRAGLAVEPEDVTTFAEWAADFIARHQGAGGKRPRKPATIRAYETTIVYANDAFGDLPLVEIADAQLDTFAGAIRGVKGGGSDATLAKHLRQLGAIFSDAVDRGKLAANPVPRYRKNLGLRVPRGDEPYTDAELEALWAKMAELKYRPVYITICKAAVATGARIGELIALDWRHLDLSNERLRIERTYDAASGFQLPKDNEPRTLHLTAPAMRVFEDWIAQVGVQPDDTPIFPAPQATKDGQARVERRIARDYLGRIVDNAREKAGIPDVGEGGRKRKPLHAFRASFARICREAGLDPQWVMNELGHSSADLTLNVYGKWSEAGAIAEAKRLGAEAFPA